mmetsp:Transcript_47929/g.103272  ORF Transcript_47929/g.103272 Transcript_47929/m.103272 type:complete len:117 (+) Transcript_47929:654-1004(+)
MVESDDPMKSREGLEAKFPTQNVLPSRLCCAIRSPVEKSKTLSTETGELARENASFSSPAAAARSCDEAPHELLSNPSEVEEEEEAEEERQKRQLPLTSKDTSGLSGEDVERSAEE